MRRTGRFRYMDSDGTWEVSTGGFKMLRDPEETAAVIRKWPEAVAKGAMRTLSDKDRGVIILKGDAY